MILYNAPSSYYSMIGRYALLEAAVPFENRRMDIHLAKEQLTPWYMAINPAMTVPALTDGARIWADSHDILNEAASRADSLWLDADTELAPHIQHIVTTHYSIAIERLTFGKALVKLPPLRFIVPRMLRKIIRSLEAERKSTDNPAAVDAKITLNQQRLAYFTEGTLADKLEFERTNVLGVLAKIPKPEVLLFGDKPSSADIVAVVLLARLKMIGEDSLVQSPALIQWFERMQTRPAYQKADIWTHFQPWRILFKR